MSAEEKSKKAAYMREWSRGNDTYTTYRREYYQQNKARIKELRDILLQQKRQDPEWVEKQRIRKREWGANRRAKMGEEAFKEYNRLRAGKHRTPEKRRELHLKSKFGLTQETWDALFESQGSVCAICKTPDPDSARGWHTDHCHGTGKVRGILCKRCNTTLGLMRDNTTYLENAIKYLVSS